MTVAELIAQLQTLPPDTTVAARDSYSALTVDVEATSHHYKVEPWGVFFCFSEDPNAKLCVLIG